MLKMKCHYEVLDVPLDADEGQIKLAYRKLALKWHPDKNLDEPELAKEQFQLVQQAYEVLSDRQERAWYDNHREQILFGGSKDFQDNSLDVFRYFTTTCFKGYDDAPDGFYTIFRKVFEDIAREDVEYMDDKEEFCMIPSFGNAQSDYDEVVGPFYAYWMSYSTKKSYVWLDAYNINETRDRRIAKLMEKENKKVRQKARKERNEEIRNLVAFVRKRDRRVHDYSKRLEAKILGNRQKQDELSRQKWLERKKMNESITQAEWTKFHNVQSELEEIEKSLAEQFGEQLSDLSNDSNSETELDNLYCVACNKVFKTPKAFQNHEFSKKHRDNLEKLKETTNEDDEELIREEMELENVSDTHSEELNAQDYSQSDIEARLTSSDREPEPINGFLDIRPKKKIKKSKNVLKATPLSDEESISNMATDGSSKNANECSISSKKSRRRSKKPKAQTTTDVKPNDSEEIPINDESHCKRSAKKGKRSVKSDPTEHASDSVDVNRCCVTCKSSFPSKNKLVDHLKKTGHAVHLPQNEKRSAKGNRKKLNED